MKKVSIKYAILFVMIAAFLPTCQVNAKTSDTISKGVFIEGIDVSGMTREEAKEAVLEYVTSLDEVQITLNVIEDKQVVTTAGELGLKWSNEDILEEAVEHGKSGNLIKRYKALKDLERQPKVMPIKFSVDREMLHQIVTEKCEAYNKKAKNPSLFRENGVFTVQDGKTGTVVDVENSIAAIDNYMLEEWNHEPATIDLVVMVDEPKGNKEDLLQVKDVLGSFTTSYHTSNAARSGNVSNGTRLINGTTLFPGESFSAYEVVNPFTEANGYYMAGSYLNGMVVDSLGGGICQVSTTLYNAVIRAELEITERFSHSMIVGYVDPSADAAIAGTYKDLKFINNTDYPIYIEGYTTPDKKVTFNVYGVETRPSNRTVTFESEVLSTSVPEVENIIADASLPVGVVRVQSAHIGYTAELWKVVKEDGVEVSRTKVNKSTYAKSPRSATVGVSTPDPNVYAAMQAAIATGSIDHVRAVAAAYNAAQQAPLPPTP